LTAVGYPLEHFYYGQLVQQGQAGGELRPLAASAGVAPGDMTEIMRAALLPPLQGVPLGAWGVVRGPNQHYVFVQSQVNRAGAVILHLVLIPSDVLRALGGNIRVVMRLLQAELPVYTSTGERLQPVILPDAGPPGPAAQVDAMLALMSCTRERLDIVEQLLAAVVRGNPMIVSNAPTNPVQRAALVEGLLVLLPQPARYSVTFAMHILANSRVDAQIRFLTNGTPPDGALVYDWAAGRILTPKLTNDYSRFIVSQFRLDPELVTEQTSALTPIAGWRLKQGDALMTALDYAAHRLTLDDALINSLPVPAAEAVRVLTEDPTLDENMRTAYARHVMAFAIGLGDVAQAEPIVSMIRRQPELEASTLQQLTDALQSGKADFVYTLILRWLQDPTGPRGMEWISLVQAAALVHLQSLVSSGNPMLLRQFLLHVHQTQAVTEMAYAMPRMLEAAVPVAERDHSLAETVFVLGVNYASAEQLQRLLVNPGLLAQLPDALAAAYGYVSGDSLGVPPPGLLVRAAAAFDESWRALVLVKLVELTLLLRRNHLLDDPTLGAMVRVASSSYADSNDTTFRWLVRTLSTDDNLPRMEPDSARALLQILLARKAYPELALELGRHLRMLYTHQTQGEYALMVRRLFLETPLNSPETLEALRNLEAGGLKPLPLAMAHFGAMKRSNWPDTLQEVAINLTTLLVSQPVAAEAVPMVAMYELLQFHVRRRDLAGAVQVASMLPRIAAFRGDQGLGLIAQSHRLMDWDNQARLAALEMVRRYIRIAEVVYARTAVDRLTDALGAGIRPQLEAAYTLRQMMDGEDVNGYAFLLHVTAELIADTALIYIDRKAAPSLKALFGDLDSLVGGLSDDDRETLATTLLELGRVIVALGQQQKQNRPRDLNAHVAALLDGKAQPQTALDVLRLLGGYFSRGTRLSIPLVQASSTHPFRDRAAPSLLLEVQMALRVLRNLHDAFPPSGKILVTPDVLRAEIESLWSEVPQNERRNMVQELGADFQSVPDLVWQIYDSGDAKALEDNSGLARKLDSNRQRPESTLELYRFVHGYFRLRTRPR
jgi:hypothetical protein